jgi:hypothetical protein
MQAEQVLLNHCLRLRESYLKISVYPAFHAKIKMAGWSSVIRDQHGEALALGAGTWSLLIITDG